MILNTQSFVWTKNPINFWVNQGNLFLCEKVVTKKLILNMCEKVLVAFLSSLNHWVESDTRTSVDWAEEIQYLIDIGYPEAEKITLVLDNLNTHTIASLYSAFSREEARRIARLEIHLTPLHGS